MKAYTLPSKEMLDQMLQYDPSTGKFRWRVRPVTMFTAERPRSAEHTCNQWNARWAGKPAASQKKGYWYIRIDYQAYLAHRVAWKIMTGADPIEIDHIDGDRGNNKWSNLKDGTRSDNLRNVALKRNNTSGYHGVAFNKRQQKWTAYITLGAFDSKEDAVVARKHAEAFLGFHANHGREASVPAT
jgi:hypothetical protein